MIEDTIEIKYPFSACTLSDFVLSDFPIFEIKIPATGIKINTNIVNLKLIEIIAINVKMIVIGSLTISSKIEKNEFWTSFTSPSILAIISPFLFSE